MYGGALWTSIPISGDLRGTFWLFVGGNYTIIPFSASRILKYLQQSTFSSLNTTDSENVFTVCECTDVNQLFFLYFCEKKNVKL